MAGSHLLKGAAVLVLGAISSLHEAGRRVNEAGVGMYLSPELQLAYRHECPGKLTPHTFGGAIIAMEQLGFFANQTQAAR